MPLVCQNCKKEYHDPGGDLSKYWCSNCTARGPLVRINPNQGEAGKVVGAGLGAAVGAGIAGPVGAVVGALVGFFLGNEADKK